MIPFLRQSRRLIVEGRSSDGRVSATIRGLHGRPIVTFGSPDDFTSFHDARSLAEALQEAIESAVDRLASERRRLLSEHTPFTIRTTDHWHPENRRMLTELQETEATGESPDGLASVTTWGLDDWDVRLPHDVFRRATAHQCATAVNTAIAAAYHDYTSRQRKLQIHE